jgi:hypothetical protein
MKLFAAILLLLAGLSCFCQNRDTTVKSPPKAAGQLANPSKPEVLNNGFIDVINNGQINGSARLIRLHIGEPGKFAIPLSFYSGVSANNFATSSVIHNSGVE